MNKPITGAINITPVIIHNDDAMLIPTRSLINR